MTVSVLEAFLAYEERKDAAFGADGATVSVDQAALLTVGLDLDADEVEKVAMLVAANLVTALTTGDCPNVALAIKSAMYEGLVTGLLLADMRQREGVTANAD